MGRPKDIEEEILSERLGIFLWARPEELGGARAVLRWPRVTIPCQIVSWRAQCHTLRYHRFIILSSPECIFIDLIGNRCAAAWCLKLRKSKSAPPLPKSQEDAQPSCQQFKGLPPAHPPSIENSPALESNPVICIWQDQGR